MVIEENSMKKTRFTEGQILSILRELESGVGVVELSRKHGVSGATIREEVLDLIYYLTWN